jgi:cell division GTPase FtsZ
MLLSSRSSASAAPATTGVNSMVEAGTQGVEFILSTTDKPALGVSNADQKIQIVKS